MDGQGKDFDIDIAGQTVEPTASAKLEDMFSYHQATPEQITRMSAIRIAAKAFSEVVVENVPSGEVATEIADTALAMSMKANFSIVTNGRPHRF